MSTAKTSHFFLRNLQGHRIGVVAMRYYTRDEGGSGVTVAVSLCHGNDPWKSSTGVAAARGRLDSRHPNEQGGNVTYQIDDDVDLADDVFRILSPCGIRKRQFDVAWFKMQALFERQWKYLTTPKPEPMDAP
jgi:hypothetical protein